MLLRPIFARSLRLTLAVSLLSIGTLSLSGCGFQPLHAPAGSTYRSALPNMDINFAVKKSKGASGQKAEYLIRNALKDRMSSSGTSPYQLDITSTISRGTVGLRSDDVASRYDMTISLKYELTNKDENLDSGSVSAVSTFNAPRDPYGTTASTDNALERAAQEAADKLILKVATAIRAQ